MTLFEALVLGLVQGLTEFLPVSSSGHLEIGKWLLGAEEADLGFSIWVHAATALSTLTVFRHEVLRLLRGSWDGETEPRRMVGLLLETMKELLSKLMYCRIGVFPQYVLSM